MTPAKVYDGVAGAALAIAGIVGFFYSADFGSPGHVEVAFGLLDVNGWQNVVHMLTGVAALLAFGAGVYAARRCALALGAVYVVIAGWGFLAGSGGTILGIVPVSTGDNALHLVVGLAGLAAGLAGERQSYPGSGPLAFRP